MSLIEETNQVKAADGALATLGAKADARSAATDTTAISAMQVLKQLSYLLQNPAALAAGTAVIGKVLTPSFSVADSLTRPANTTPYAANKSINCSLTVTGVSYVGTSVTLTISGHPLAAGDRITVAGINSGAQVSPGASIYPD